MIKMYGSPRGNQKQLEKFIVRIGEKRTELEQKQKDLEVMLGDLLNVEAKCHVALANVTNRD
jgi:hypothetical protein